MTEPRDTGDSAAVDDVPGHGDFSIGSSCWPGTSKVIEEMGEALQVLGKLIATHGETAHWDGSDLRVLLIEELGDVYGAIDFFTRENLTVSERVRVAERADAKRRLFCDWQDAQSPTAVSGRTRKEPGTSLQDAPAPATEVHDGR